MAKCKNCTNLYNLSDDNDVIVGKWCPKVNDSPDTENESDCENYKCMTHGDRIRSMSDEELAEFLRKTVEEDGTNLFDCEEFKRKQACKNHPCNECVAYLYWLQSEVEE